MKISNKRNRMHYAWVIFACCVLLRLGVGGVVGCLAGNFVTPVVNDLGCAVSQFTLFVSVEAAAMALMYTTASKMLLKRKLSRVVGLASMLEVSGIALMAVYPSAFWFNLSGLLLGVGSAFTGFVAIPVIINMWFKKKAGTVLGAVMAAGYVATVGYSYLSGMLIDSFGWRNSYLILAVVAFFITVPAALFLLKTPQDAGCEPYGAEEGVQPLEPLRCNEAEWGLTRRQAFCTPAFYLVWLACMLYSISNSVAGYIATYATMELQQSISFGAKAYMCYNLGCVGCSVILGYINDKWGVRAGIGWGTALSVLGYATMLFSLGNVDLVIPAAMLVGLGGSMYTVQSPLLVKSVLGTRHYSDVWAVIMVGNSLAGAFSYSPVGMFYDVGGSYRGAFLCALGIFTAAFLLGNVSVTISRRRLRPR